MYRVLPALLVLSGFTLLASREESSSAEGPPLDIAAVLKLAKRL